MSQVVFFALSLRPRHGERIFHYLFIIALLVGSIAYLAQASDLAWRVVAQNNMLTDGHTRQIFWAKYVNWVVAFPVAIIVLGLLSTVSWASIVYNVALSWIWYELVAQKRRAIADYSLGSFHTWFRLSRLPRISGLSLCLARFLGSYLQLVYSPTAGLAPAVRELADTFYSLLVGLTFCGSSILLLMV